MFILKSFPTFVMYKNRKYIMLKNFVTGFGLCCLLPLGMLGLMSNCSCGSHKASIAMEDTKEDVVNSEPELVDEIEKAFAWNDSLVQTKTDTCIEYCQQLIDKHAYILSYNNETRCPNYVAWKLTKERLTPNVERTDFFVEDEDVDLDYRVKHSDYSNSGYDRGHMCPAADNRFDMTAMEECFTMSNICPQNRTLNAGDWNDLEEKCRRLARKSDAVYIVCGPIFNGGNKRYIGKRKKHKIAVPDKFFKVILVNNNDTYMAIGYVMDNDDSKKDLADYAVSVDVVEQLTGFDFFYNLPDSVENEVEKNNDYF